MQANTPKVFGLGLSRTGTHSLTTALEILGYKACHFPETRDFQEDFLRGNYNFRILQHVDALTDTPVVLFYPQLHAIFPDAKFILTVREKSNWLHGCQHSGCFPTPQINNYSFLHIVNLAVYGCGTFNRDRFSAVYDQHVKNVLDYFKDYPESLLVLNICGGEGWEPLCNFLKKPIPNMPFPRKGGVKKSSAKIRVKNYARPNN